MIFDGAMVIYAIRRAKALHDQELQALKVMADSLSPEDFRAAVAQMEAKKETWRKQAEDERRHQETVAAIRSTSFWRFGSRR